MRLRRLVPLAALLVVSLQPIAASAHLNWQVDDNCGPVSGTYISMFGPANYWYTGIDGSWLGPTGCYTYTSTTSLSSPINWAEWYLPSQPEFCGGYVHDFYADAWIGDGPNWTTANAHYHRWRYGHQTGTATEHYRFSQAALTDQYKRVTATGSTPPTYDHFDACEGGMMDIYDNTGDASFKYMGVDLMKWTAIIH